MNDIFSSEKLAGFLSTIDGLQMETSTTKIFNTCDPSDISDYPVKGSIQKINALLSSAPKTEL